MKLLRLAAILLLVLQPLPSFAASSLTVTKTPIESFNLGADFSAVSGADGITLVSVIATDIKTGGDVTSNIVAVSPAPVVSTAITVNGQVRTGQFLVVRVQGGTNQQRVLLGLRVSDNVTGEIFEAQITLLINSGLVH